jgi:cytochrome c-type biogenesis protein CcmH
VTVFVIAAAVLALGTLAYVLRPLWATRTSGRPLAGAALVALLAMTTALLYALVGTPDALDPAQRAAPQTLAEAVTQLEAELERDPNQVDGLRLLGRSYAALERRADARDSFARAIKLAPDDPDLLVEAAEARAMANAGNRFDADAVALLRAALALQPMHQRGRWFLGIAQRQAGQPAEAAKTWEPLLIVVEAATANTLRPQIDAARQEAGLPPLPPAAAPASGPNALTLTVALDPDFAARVRLRGDTTVFVIARVPGGPPMPVAVEKHPLSSLPLTVTLDDADSLMPTQKLSALKEIEVFARLSASGDATRQDGDIESAPVRVALPASAPIALTIGTAR